MEDPDQFFLDFRQQWERYMESKDHRLLQAMAFAESMMLSSLDLSVKVRKNAYKRILKNIQSNPRPDYSIYLLGMFLGGFEHFSKDLEKALKKLSGKSLRRFTQHASMFHTMVNLWGKKELQELKKIRKFLQNVMNESSKDRIQGRLLGLSLITPSCEEIVQREIIGQIRSRITKERDENVLVTSTQALTLASLGSGILEPVLAAQLELLSSKRRHARSMAALGLSSIIPWVESTSLRKNVLERMINASTSQVVDGVIYSYLNLFFREYPKNVPRSLLNFLKNANNDIYEVLHDVLSSWDQNQSLTSFYETIFELDQITFWKAVLLGSFYLEWAHSRNASLMREMAEVFHHILETHHMSSVQNLAMNRLISVVLTTREVQLISGEMLDRMKQQLLAKSGSSHDRQDTAMSYVILRSLSQDLVDLKSELEEMIPSLDLAGLTGLLLGLGSALYLHLPEDLPHVPSENWLKNDEFYFGLLQWMKDTREEAILQLFQAFSQVGLSAMMV